MWLSTTTQICTQFWHFLQQQIMTSLWITRVITMALSINVNRKSKRRGLLELVTRSLIFWDINRTERHWFTISGSKFGHIYLRRLILCSIFTSLWLSIKCKLVMNSHMLDAVADLRGGARDARPPGPKFLYFHAVFWKNWPSNRLASSLRG